MTDVVKSTNTVKLTVDGIEVEAEKGELVIRVAERIGIAIPRFCDHPLLAPAGACRQCLVDIEGQRKPVASRSEEHTSELQSLRHLVCRLLLEKKKKRQYYPSTNTKTQHIIPY